MILWVIGICFILIQFDFNFLKANSKEADEKLNFEVPDLSTPFVPIPKLGCVSLRLCTLISITVKLMIM